MPLRSTGALKGNFAEGLEREHDYAPLNRHLGLFQHNHIVNGHSTVRSRYRETRLAGRPILTSALSAHEVLFGAAISKRPLVQTKSALELLAELTIVDFTGADAVSAAELRSQLRRQGQPIGGFDMLIAGQALERRWTVVTANTREFGRVEGLEVEDWRVPVA